MIYRDKDTLPASLRNVVVTIEWSQDSEFVKAYRDPNNGWRLVFKTLFNNPAEFFNVESYLEKLFNFFDDYCSYFEALSIEDDQQVIYLKDGSTF